MENSRSVFKIIVKTNSKNNEIISYNKENKTFKLAIKAAPHDNKANIEIIKFLSKHFKKKVMIIKGFRSKEKLISLE
ncbi:MAG TPA: DUF167 domain-containing protein [Candidatus Nanoarchaeia archaeon]|nr:DUF167 domain-containing protein [Candidatus Nanoarchaeia archaeon]